MAIYEIACIVQFANGQYEPNETNQIIPYVQVQSPIHPFRTRSIDIYIYLFI